MNSITVMFQVICLYLRSPCFQVHLKERSNNFEIQCILCYSRYKVISCQPLQLVRLSDFKNTKKNRLINSVYFYMQSIKKKWIRGKYRVKKHSEKRGAWYMKIKWKLQYQFADTKIKWLMGKRNILQQFQRFLVYIFCH